LRAAFRLSGRVIAPIRGRQVLFGLRRRQLTLGQFGIVLRPRRVYQFAAIYLQQRVIGQQRVMPFEILRIDLHASPRILSQPL
jgi:hypothetical protein